MKTAILGLITSVFIAAPAMATPAKIIHQTKDSPIVRMSLDSNYLVWQEVGGSTTERYLQTLNIKTGAKGLIDAGSRPFLPFLAEGMVIFGAGRINTGVTVAMYDLNSKRKTTLKNSMRWITEGALQVVKRNGKDVVQAVWDQSEDIFGSNLEIMMYEGARDGSGTQRSLVQGPVELRDVIPREFFPDAHNEYPEISGNIMVFQNNEYGLPNVYRMDLTTGIAKRISPSLWHQERPHIAGRYTAWEESESGFAGSDLSNIYVHDSETNVVKKVTNVPGYHFQVRVAEHYIIYGAKREPMPKTPSARVYDMELDREYDLMPCFSGSLMDIQGSKEGVYGAQRLQTGNSRVLFATWDQVKNGCQ